MSQQQGAQSTVEALPEGEAVPLLQRAAARRNLAEVGPAEGVGGMRAKLAPGEKTQRAVWGTYAKDRGLIALFEDDRLLGTANQTLGEILAVQWVKLPGLDYGALMVDDRVDNMVGAYFTIDNRRVLIWTGKGWREAWKEQLSLEEYHHSSWVKEERDGPNRWILRLVKGATALHNGVLDYQVREEELQAPASPQDPLPNRDRFRPVSDRQYVLRYRFDPGRLRFVPEHQEGLA